MGGGLSQQWSFFKALIPNVLIFPSIDGIPYARRGGSIYIKYRLELYLHVVYGRHVWAEIVWKNIILGCSTVSSECFKIVHRGGKCSCYSSLTEGKGEMQGSAKFVLEISSSIRNSTWLLLLWNAGSTACCTLCFVALLRAREERGSIITQ